MKVVFRADASQLVGTGHVMRCLTLASALTKEGAQCSFICREQPGNLIDFIRKMGFDVAALPKVSASMEQVDGTAHSHFLGCSQEKDARDCSKTLKEGAADWLVVDHYGLDSRWEEALLPTYEKLMVIDDLADRPHKCDILLDQTFGRTKQDYLSLTSTDCMLLCGAQYSLLRPEFSRMRQQSLERRKNNCSVKKLLISMGGVDKDNVTGKVLQSLKRTFLPDNIEIAIVMGPHAPWIETVRELAGGLSWRTEVYTSVENMAELMAGSDLAIGGAGATAWERCCLGLPSVVVVLADNQRLIARNLQQAGAAIQVEIPSDVDTTPFLKPLLFESEKLLQMSLCAAEVTDGQGVKYVLDTLFES